MTFQLDRVVPWGRSFDEYVAMFAVTKCDLRKSILGCADGPASFNAELTARGGTIVSFDPLYAHSLGEIRRRIDQTFPEMVEKAKKNSDEFIWSLEIPDAESLGRVRMDAMELFLRDYTHGRKMQRYVAAELPDAILPRAKFELAVCSHFLFLYSDMLSEQFHIDSIRRLMQHSEELRIFPLLQLDGKTSRHLTPVRAAVAQHGYKIVIEQVDYEFQKGGNQMMRITR